MDLEEPFNETYPPWLERGYRFWSEKAEKNGKLFVPSTIPGSVELRESEGYGFYDLPSARAR